MRTAVVMPWRAGDPWRERVYRWVKSAWSETGLPLYVGVDDDGGPFNCARALNRAREKAGDVDVLIVAAADHVPNPKAVKAGEAWCAQHPWMALFDNTVGVSARGTRMLLEGSIDAGALPLFATGSFGYCTALLAVRASAWDALGGWDERFHGWGCEDTAFRLALETLYPAAPTGHASTYALFHDAAPRDHFDRNCALLGEYQAAASSPDEMRQVLLRWRS